MTLHRSLLVASIGFGLLQAGCLAGSDEVNALGDVGLETLTGGGDDDPGSGTGTNGLETFKFHPSKATLWNALDNPLYVNGTTTLNADVLALVDPGNPAGQKTFTYAAKCALSTNTVVDYGTSSYPGAGILNSTAMWPDWGLDHQAKLDLFACMALHLNPSGTPVGIQFAGLNVNDAPPPAGTPTGNYTFKEALWAAENTSSSASTLMIHVWPLDDVHAYCSTMTNLAILTRVCGQGNTSCGVTVHDNVAEDCQETSPGVYTMCNKMNVIQTWLDPVDVPNLYGVCSLPL